MGSLGPDPAKAVAGIFNSAIAAAAIPTAWELGLLDELRLKRSVDVEAFAARQDLDPASLQGLVTTLAIADVLQRDRGAVVAGRLFDEAFRTKGFFHWLALGSGDLFSRMPAVLRNENRVGEDYYTRDARAIAYACRDINHLHYDPVFWRAMKGLDYQVSRVVDLGSGSGERLMQILDRFPGTTGLGIDVAAAATDFAAAAAASRGLADRLAFVQGDARQLQPRDEFLGSDLLACFLMGHDFWPRPDCVRALRQLREAFPNVRRFLLGDTARGLLGCEAEREATAARGVPIFTLGFEFGHAMMGVTLPTMSDWEGVFEEGGWRCLKKHMMEVPGYTVIFELEPLRS